MTLSNLYSVGDSVRVDSAVVHAYATIESVCEHTRTYVVRYDRDKRSVVAHDHCERYRKQRYERGDRVELYREPLHEGPHPDDFDAPPPPVALITRVVTHPNNDEWITDYVVETLDDFELKITPGKIARLAPELVVHYFDHGTSDAYDYTQTRDVIRDGDVLVVADADAHVDDDTLVVGFLARAWPIAISEQSGAFHTLASDADVTCLGKRDEKRMTLTIHPDNAEPFEQEEVFAADPGRDYTASVELAQRELREALQRRAEYEAHELDSELDAQRKGIDR